MSGSETILFSVDEGVASIVLNRPNALNALNARMADELVEALTAVQENPDARVVLLEGAGGAFCSGGDVRDTSAAGPRTATHARAGMERYRRLTLALHDLDKPVIAAADGVAFGAGFSLLLLADMVLLSERARLCMAFQRIGLLPDCGALYTLPRAVGVQRAKELILSGREVQAGEALSLGLAMEVVPPMKLPSRARQLARALCGASPSAVPLTKRALNASMQSDLSTMLALEASGQGVALSSDYLAEAARRFASKQPPLFSWQALE